MAKLAGKTPLRPGGVVHTQPRVATRFAGPRNHEGSAAHLRDVKSDLFLLGVTNFVSERSFYESAEARDARFKNLVIDSTAADPTWTARFISWLRTEGNMRSASIVAAVEYGVTLGAALGDGSGTIAPSYRDAPPPRAVLASALQRADEPGEALGYFLATYGKPFPKWFKKGLGDAVLRLFSNPYNVLKYDGQGQPVRLADVLEVSQIDRARGADFEPVAKWVLDRRHGRTEGDYGIEMLRQRYALEQIAKVGGQRDYLAADPEAARTGLRLAGYTWESLSGWLQGPMDAKAWESIIPTMGYMALLRNLRNFDEAEVSDTVAQSVIARLTDPAQVAKSRQLPMRFLSAYQMVPSDRWKYAIGQALDLSLANVPALDGRTLVLIDISSSMRQTFSDKTRLRFWDAAALFGIALAKSAHQADIFGFAHEPREFKLQAGASVLSNVKRFVDAAGGGGATYTKRAIESTYRPGIHKRIVVLTDEQAQHDGLSVYDGVSDKIPCYTYNLAGYSRAMAPAGTATRHAVGGLTDAGFKMMQVLEGRAAGKWPWEVE